MNPLIPIGIAGVLFLLFVRKPSRAPSKPGALDPVELRKLYDAQQWPQEVDFHLFDTIAYHESKRNPSQQTNIHRGLWQLGPENVADYNEAHGTSHSPSILFDAKRSMPIIAWHANQVATALRQAGLERDHPQYAGFFYAAHNAGWSRTAGMACLLREASKAGEKIEEIRLEHIPMLARRCPKGSEFLRDPVRLAYWERVQQTYDQ